MSKMTACVRDMRESVQAVEGSEAAERFQGGGAVLGLGPARGFLGGEHAAEHELTVAGADDVIGESRQVVGGEIAEGRGRRLVVLVLEPGQSLDPAEHGSEVWRALLPRRSPALLVGVLGTDLEEEAH